MTHQMIECKGRPGQYLCQCQCGEKFEADWLSDLIYSFNSHTKTANKIEADNVFSIFTKQPLMV